MNNLASSSRKMFQRFDQTVKAFLLSSSFAFVMSFPLPFPFACGSRSLFLVKNGATDCTGKKVILW